MDATKLQVDHRIPYEIGGEHDEKDIDYFMLLSPSANRAKSWTCEHCKNWEVKNPSFVCDAIGRILKIMIMLPENQRRLSRLYLQGTK